MKNYRLFKKYESNEWEEDKAWLGKRLSFVWDVRYYWPRLYIDLKLNEEKNNFYEMADSDVHSIASSDHYSVDNKYYEALNMNEHELYSRYMELQHMKESSKSEFLKKNNCNMYEWVVNNHDIAYLRQQAECY